MIKPKQAIPTSEKTKAWKETNLKYFNKSLLLASNTKRDYIKGYKGSAGIMNGEEYTHLTNPYGVDEPKKQAATLKNYDIKSPIFMQLLGEFLKRTIEPTVFCRNGDLENQKTKKEYEMLLQSLQQVFVNTLIQSGQFVEGQTDEQGQPINPPLSPEYIKKQVSSVVDTKAIEGQSILEYILNNQKIVEKWIALFYDFISVKECFSYKVVHIDEVIYKRIDPFNIVFEDSQELEHLEDSNAVKTVGFFSLNALIDLFQDEEDFNDALIRELEGHSGMGSDTYSFMQRWARNFSINRGDTAMPKEVDDYLNLEKGVFPLCHIQWASLKKVARIYTVDVFGNPIQIDVDEDYIASEGEKLEYRWVKEIREGYVLNDKHYFGGDAIHLQRGSFDNPNSCKLSYNHKRYMKLFPYVKTISESLDPYQHLYNELKYKMSHIINKNKDKLLVLPIGLFGHFAKEHQVRLADGTTTIEIDESSAIEEGLYYADNTGIIFVDETEKGAMEAIQSIKAVDLSLSNYVQQLYQYAEQTKSEAEELVGFNRFRKANINSSDAVSNVNSGAYAGSLITEMIFHEFNTFVEVECQGIIDIAKYAYRKGKKAQYARSDFSTNTLNIEEGSIQEMEYGIFAKNGGKIKEDYELLKQRSLEFAQNGMSPSMVGKIISATGNYSSLMEEIENKEREMEEKQQQAQQQQSQIEQSKIEASTKIAEAQNELAYYKIDEDNTTKLSIAFGSLYASASAGESGDNLIIKLKEIENKFSLEVEKNQIKRMEMLIKASVSHEQNKSKERIADKQVLIARTNKN